MDATAVRAVVIILVALSFGAVAAVVRLYAVAYRRLPRTAGLMPLHVALVSVSVLITQGTLAWALIESFSREAAPSVAIRTVLFGLASLLLLVALYVVGRLQRRRVRFARDRTAVVVHETDTVTAVEDPRPPS